jgi:hypothetical protein
MSDDFLANDDGTIKEEELKDKDLELEAMEGDDNLVDDVAEEPDPAMLGDEEEEEEELV